MNMKLKLLIVLAGLVAFAAGNLEAGNITKALPLAATSVAANSTNATAGTAIDFGGAAPREIVVQLTGSGVAATTNGAFALDLVTSQDGTTYESAELTLKTVTISTLGATTNTTTEWFTIVHANYLKQGRMRNTFNGAVSNLAASVAWKEPGK